MEASHYISGALPRTPQGGSGPLDPRIWVIITTSHWFTINLSRPSPYCFLVHPLFDAGKIPLIMMNIAGGFARRAKVRPGLVIGGINGYTGSPGDMKSCMKWLRERNGCPRHDAARTKRTYLL